MIIIIDNIFQCLYTDNNIIYRIHYYKIGIFKKNDTSKLNDKILS